MVQAQAHQDQQPRQFIQEVQDEDDDQQDDICEESDEDESKVEQNEEETKGGTSEEAKKPKIKRVKRQLSINTTNARSDLSLL